jgi:uncharacterized protein (TIGR00369 family)
MEMTPDAYRVELGELDIKLGIEIIEDATPGRLVATMPVAGNRQPFGRLHGGASMVLGECLGSFAALAHARTMGKTAVGLDINGTHHRAARGGLLTGVATPIHLGRRTASHEIVIADEDGKRVATIRITNLLIDAEHQ